MITRQDCLALDASDPLAPLREQFALPAGTIYLDGNSLGVLPRATPQRVAHMVQQEWGNDLIESWNKAGWIDLPLRIGDKIARLVGADPGELVAADSTSVNLFKVLTAALAIAQADAPERRVILSERGNFPTDLYIAEALARERGCELVLVDEPGEIDGQLAGGRVAVLMLTQVNYRSGRLHDMAAVTRTAHRHGTLAVWDLAHSAGALPVSLKADGADFAVGCGYKYLNGGPGTLAGCFVHERHASDFAGPRFAGWWGHDKASRFRMGPRFQAIPGAEGWQLSNPPILQIAALRASLELFDRATMPALRAKSERLTGYLEYLLDELPGRPVHVVTPRETARRGCQLSLRFGTDARRLLTRLKDSGVVCDFREPDIIRAAPAPLYNTFHDVWRFVDVVGGEVAGRGPKGDA